MEKRYQAILKDLADPQITVDVKKTTELMKELRSLEKAVDKYKEYKKIVREISDLEELAKTDEEDIAELAKAELDKIRGKDEEIVLELKKILLPKDENDGKGVVVEIRGAAGGEEANIFAADLFRMYSRFAEAKGWKTEITNSQATGLGGFSIIEFMIYGSGAYAQLKYESGAHRVQRVPVTESSGRIQTSTATVLVMPEAEATEIELNMEDVRVDTYCASGPGGQCVNTTKSAVRLTHIPSGLVVQCQDGKSQHENKANALKVLRARLYDKITSERLAAEGKEKFSKIGRGNRSEKIRTYNYPQNRVTDHRINFTIQQLDRIMEGKLDPIIEALINHEEAELLKGEEQS